MAENQLQVELRDRCGKGAARKLRAAGRIPAVCYGQGTDSVLIALEPRTLEKILSRSAAGMNTLIDLVVDGPLGGRKVLVKELQRDPVSGMPLHADLLAIDVTRRVEVSVPLQITGKAAGVELGGILDQALREVELACLPTAIPEEVQVDVSPLQLGESLHIRDIPLPEGVELLSDPDLSVVSIVAPAEQPAEEEGEEAAEAPAESTAGEASSE